MTQIIVRDVVEIESVLKLVNEKKSIFVTVSNIQLFFKKIHF